MKTLFQLPQHQLSLELQDTATSDDPLLANLQRKGWDLKRVKQLQNSISEKLTIDMFNKQTRTLSASELELQRDIQKHLDKKGTT